MARYLHWDEEDMFNHIRTSLEGVTGQVLWNLGPQSCTEDVVRVLQTRFDTQLNGSKQSCTHGGGSG